MCKIKWSKVINKNLLLVCASVLLMGASTISTKANETDKTAPTSEGLVAKSYSEFLETWNKKFTVNDSLSSSQTIISSVNHGATNASETFGYKDPTFLLENKNDITFQVTAEKEGLYNLQYDYYSLAENLSNPEFSVLINNQLPYTESNRIVAPTTWENASEKFVKNEDGNELIPDQKVKKEWKKTLVKDADYEDPTGLLFHLNKGVNTVTFKNQNGRMLVGNLYASLPQSLQKYSEYHKQQESSKVKDELITIEAEHTYEKNNSFIRPASLRTPDVSPYNSKYKLLNVLDGKSWNKSGQSATWKFEIENSGNYKIILKALQDNKEKSPVFRTIYLDGKIPFKEMEHYSLLASNKWDNIPLGEKEGGYEFYLEKGTHYLTMEADSTLLSSVVTNLKQTMTEMNDVGLSIKKLTGGQEDQAREWDLAEYLPEINDNFKSWITTLNQQKKEILDLYGKTGDRSQEIVKLKIVIDRLEKLSKDINTLPTKLSEFSEGSSSATQLLGDLQTYLVDQPLTVDEIYLTDNLSKVPAAKASWYEKTSTKIKEFFLSFTAKSSGITEVDDDTLEVWVSRSQQYVELLQNMADNSFTKETGKKVKLSVMPNEQKLILANSSGKQPDVALGLAMGTPYELAIRGAATDLSQFPDFKEVLNHFAPGAILPMTLNDKIYGLPETQDFYVQFARKDILNKLNIKIPDNWNEVLEILPELQRYGMNYFVPLSSSAGTKPFMFTSPFIYQFNGDLYSENGLTTAINSEEALNGIRFMTDLYTMYSMPLQVPNFYNSFRQGTLPIGIGNLGDYIKLVSAAPEIANQWEISLYPGTLQKDGSVSRWATGSAQTSMMFNKSKKKDTSWKFLKWWLSTKTQTDFSRNLQTIYGPEYMWSTANLDAFKELPWAEKDKQVILNQWQYLREEPKSPGANIIERELSNVWTDVVFKGKNLRASVDDRTILINREMRRKYEEFGYMKDGKVVKPYPVPTIEKIEEMGR